MSLLSVLLLGAGAWLLVPSPSSGRLAISGTRTRRLRGPDLAAIAAGVGIAVLLGGVLGAVLGVIVAVAARAGLRAVPADTSDDAEELSRQAPDAVDCLAACMAAGAPLWPAITGVAQAFGEPLGPILAGCVKRRDMGASVEQVFAGLTEEPALAPVGRVLVRSSESGSALTAALLACAEQLRTDRAALLDRKARAVGVKAVGPLGLCFLPAFVVLAVVPIVGSMVMKLL